MQCHVVPCSAMQCHNSAPQYHVVPCNGMSQHVPTPRQVVAACNGGPSRACCPELRLFSASELVTEHMSTDPGASGGLTGMWSVEVGGGEDQAGRRGAVVVVLSFVEATRLLQMEGSLDVAADVTGCLIRLVM